MTYSSSTDDSSSLGTPSAIPQASTEAPASDTCQENPTSPGASPISRETEEEEKKDRLTEVPERSAILRTSIRSLSPFRRHSWGPGKNSAGETEISQRRYESPLFCDLTPCTCARICVQFTWCKYCHHAAQAVVLQSKKTDITKTFFVSHNFLREIAQTLVERLFAHIIKWSILWKASHLSVHIHKAFMSKSKSLCGMQTAFFCPLETGHWGYDILRGLNYS